MGMAGFSFFELFPKSSFEPATPGLEGRCSIRIAPKQAVSCFSLSYMPM